MHDDHIVTWLASAAGCCTSLAGVATRDIAAGIILESISRYSYSYLASKNALTRNIARIARKARVLFSCIPARSCEILWDLAGILQDSY